MTTVHLDFIGRSQEGARQSQRSEGGPEVFDVFEYLQR